MEQLSAFSSVADVLHALSQGLLVPDIILLLAFAAYALFCIGSIVMEFFTERRNYRTNMPKFLNDLMKADETDIPQVVAQSGLLNRQKSALLTVFDYRTLHDDALLALVRREVFDEEKRYDAITGRNNTAAKISPMLGLMGTLIPLGPGVAALGQADTSALSASLLVAFDTTVAGLAVAAVCLAVGKIRSNWYGDYMSSLESGMATMLQKIEDLRSQGKIEAAEPSDYAFLFKKGLEDASEASDTRRAAGAATTEAAKDEPAVAGAAAPATTPATASAAGAATTAAAPSPAVGSASQPVATGAGYTAPAPSTATRAAEPAGVAAAGVASSTAATTGAHAYTPTDSSPAAASPAVAPVSPEPQATRAQGAHSTNDDSPLPTWQRSTLEGIAARMQAVAEKQAAANTAAAGTAAASTAAAAGAAAETAAPADPEQEGGSHG